MIIVGGPISNRDWILEPWYDHAEAAAERAGVEIRFLHVGDPNTDPITWSIIEHRQPDALVVHTTEPHRRDRRDWPWERFNLMAELRNKGLEVVRAERPDFYLSLDTDILIHPDGLKLMLEAIEGWDAVGGKCFMTYPSPHEISWGVFKNDGGIRRGEAPPGALFKVDVIMGIKLMSPAAYAVDYKFDTHGEDLGWARNCREAGLKFRWDGRVGSKHCFTPDMLTFVDPRIGW